MSERNNREGTTVYEFIDKNSASQLRAERIHHLEAQHFRLGLELEEVPGNEGIKGQMAEIERRIDMHRRILGAAPLNTLEQENGQEVVTDSSAEAAGGV